MPHSGSEGKTIQRVYSPSPQPSPVSLCDIPTAIFVIKWMGTAGEGVFTIFSAFGGLDARNYSVTRSKKALR